MREFTVNNVTYSQVNHRAVVPYQNGSDWSIYERTYRAEIARPRVERWGTVKTKRAAMRRGVFRTVVREKHRPVRYAYKVKFYLVRSMWRPEIINHPDVLAFGTPEAAMQWVISNVRQVRSDIMLPTKGD